MPTDAHTDLTRAAQLLQRAAPDEFLFFIKAFRGVLNELTVAVTDAEPGEVLIEQGKVRETRRLFECLTTTEAPQP